MNRHEFREFLRERCGAWPERWVEELWKSYRAGHVNFYGKVCVITRIVVHCPQGRMRVHASLFVNFCELRSVQAAERCLIKRLGPYASLPPLRLTSIRREHPRKLEGKFRGLLVKYYTATYRGIKKPTLRLAA